MVDESGPVEAGHVAGDVGFDWEGEEEVVSGCFGGYCDVVFDQIQVDACVLQVGLSVFEVGCCGGEIGL